MKQCSDCGRTEEETKFYTSRISTLSIKTLSASENPEKRRTQLRRYNLKTKYGLSLEEYDAILIEQNGRCKICKKLPEEVSRRKNRLEPLTVDHKQDIIRGLLCYHCNVGLGNFLDDPNLLRAAIEYLEGSENY